MSHCLPSLSIPYMHAAWKISDKTGLTMEKLLAYVILFLQPTVKDCPLQFERLSVAFLHVLHAANNWLDLSRCGYEFFEGCIQ